MDGERFGTERQQRQWEHTNNKLRKEWIPALEMKKDNSLDQREIKSISDFERKSRKRQERQLTRKQEYKTTGSQSESNQGQQGGFLTTVMGVLSSNTEGGSQGGPSGSKDQDQYELDCRGGVNYYWICAKQAAEHALQCRPKVEALLTDYHIQRNDYALYTGYDMDLILKGVGYLQQIHVFIANELSDVSTLAVTTELGRILSPFSSILFTPKSCHRLPIFKSDGQHWDFDEFTFATAAKILDRASPMSVGSNIGITYSRQAGSRPLNDGTDSNRGDVSSSDSQLQTPNRSGRNGDRKNDRKGDKSDKRGKDEEEDGKDDSDKDPDDPDDPPPSDVGSMRAFTVSFEVVSEIYSAMEENIFQSIQTDGSIAIQMGKDYPYSRCQVGFTRLRTDSVWTTADTGYEQFHILVTVDSRQKNATITDIRPQQTLAFDRDAKFISSSKNSWSLGAAATGMFSFGSPRLSLTASGTHAREKATSLEKKLYTSSISQHHRYGAVWWGFAVDDPIERTAGTKLTKDTLPTSSISYKATKNNSKQSIEEQIDIEVISSWSLIPQEHRRQSDWIKTIILGETKNGVGYSHLFQIIVTNVPTDMQTNSEYKATLRVNNTTVDSPNLEVREEEGPSTIKTYVSRKGKQSSAHQDSILKHSVLELPNLRVPILGCKAITATPSVNEDSSKSEPDACFSIPPQSKPSTPHSSDIIRNPHSLRTSWDNAKPTKLPAVLNQATSSESVPESIHVTAQTVDQDALSSASDIYIFKPFQSYRPPPNLFGTS